MNQIIKQIFETFRRNGHLEYGERVSMLQHSLQAAVFAERDGADEQLIAAALLHDYGHLIHGLPQDIADQGINGVHEEIGARELAPYFLPSVTEPIRLHVSAKRYLCSRDPAYFASLSPASVQSLELQGGPFNEKQAAAFEQHPHFEAAVRLRRYDEKGKVIGMETPPLEHFRSYLQSSLVAQ